MTAYYNENDPAAAHVLRHMIDAGVIAHGVVDERSIKEVSPDDVKDFAQVHLFAGGGFWSVAARLAGWPDDEPLWTASCPCQPFSAAGKGDGTDDPRHLWPDVYRLARAIRPPVIMGEQVAQKAGYGWFDGVRSDMAREDYASRSVDFPACSVNAPHQRNRQYWISVADVSSTRRESESHDAKRISTENPRPGCRTHAGDMVNRESIGRSEGRTEYEFRGRRSATPGTDLFKRGDVVYSVGPGLERQRGDGYTSGRTFQGGPVAATDVGVNYWHDAEWIVCHDDKARRTKPGLRFLVDGLPGRVDLWRVGGNAIVPEAAKEVIAAFIDAYGLPSGRGAL